MWCVCVGVCYGVHMSRHTDRAAAARVLTAAVHLFAACLLIGAVVLPAAAHTTDGTPTVGTIRPATPGDFAHTPRNVPTWTRYAAARYPGCMAKLPAGQYAAAVVVVREDGTLSRVPFTTAYRWTHNPGTDTPDVWVIGACPAHH